MSATTPERAVCLADEIALLAAQVDVGVHRLLTCVRQFDQSEEWGRQGARSCADWLAWRIGLLPGAAREKVRVAGPEGARDAYLDDGTRVCAETFRRMSCDGALVAVATGDAGEVLDVGRKTRTVPAAIRRALWSRDHGCRFPMCTNRRFVHAHHVDHWAHGGRTSLENLVLLCGFHHRLLHEGGFKMSLASDRTARFFTPAGREIAVVPDAPAPQRVASSIDDPDINLCRWDGEPVAYDAAVDAICAASV